MVCISRPSITVVPPLGTINVAHGAHDINMALAGFSVEEVQYSLRDVLNLDMTADAYVDGVRVENTFLLPPCVRLEFIQPWGRKAASPAYRDRLFCGDASDVIRKYGIRANLIVTSPPFADARKKSYGGIHPDKYVEWFMPYANEFYNVLPPDGTFILNIKEGVVNGERHTYVHDLIQAMRARGWLWTEEWCWAKTNSTPGRWPNRLRDAWEHILQFNKNRKFAMYQDNVMVPAKESTKLRMKHLSEKDMERQESQVGSGFGKRYANWVGREWVYPSNVLYGPTECGNTGHPAAFPEWLPEFFIKLFTQPGDVVLDPFIGSGTTAVPARRLGRRFVGIDKEPAYIKIARERVRRMG